MELCDVYRANDVNRWQIVKTVRSQSLAEHSFGVALIADRLVTVICPTIDMLNRHAIIMWSLWHDMPEVYTGDIATPLKQYIKKQCPVNPFAIFESVLCGGKYNLLYKHAHEEYPQIAAIVKLADLIESIKFLDQNVMTDHGHEIRNKLHTTFYGTILNYNKKWPEFEWNGAKKVHNEIFATETHLDDLV